MKHGHAKRDAYSAEYRAWCTMKNRCMSPTAQNHMEDSKVTEEQRWEFLLVAAKRVHTAFREGRNPTAAQLGQLDSAILAIETQKICGHRLIDECDCSDGD